MIRVLHIIDELRRGGKERQFVELLRGIGKDEFEIFTISFLPRPDGYDEFVKEHSKDFRYFERRFRWDIFLVFKLIRYCRENEIDLIYVWDGMTAFYGLIAALFVKAKFINGSIRDTDARKSYRHIIKRILLKLSKFIVANSKAGLTVYDVQDKGKVIYNGLDLTRFTAARKVNKIFTIGIVANLTDYKDYYTFFDAMALLKERGKVFTVKVVGWGKLAEEYKRYSEQKGLSGIIDFIGRVSNSEEFIAGFDVGILSSYAEKGEGLSNSVIEYMAMGVPPVITDIGAAREIITPGKTGFVFAPGDAGQLANHIEYLMDSPVVAAIMGAEARKFVEERFSFATYIRETESYYREVLIK